MALHFLSTLFLFSLTGASARPMSNFLAASQVKDEAGSQGSQLSFYMEAGKSSNIHIGQSDVEITLDRSWTARARSQNLLPIGSTVQAVVQCPSQDTNGLNTAFYTSSMEGTSDQDEIDFEFLGNQKTFVQTNYYVKGLGHHEMVIYMGFDCSEPGHTFSIYYGSDCIKWSIDNKVVREVWNSYDTPFSTKPQYAYLSLWDASAVNNGAWTGVNTWSCASFVASFSNFLLQLQASSSQSQSSGGTSTPSTASIVFDAGDSPYVQIGSSSLQIKLDQSGTGRARTQDLVPLGRTLSSSVQCPSGDTSGLVTAFYTSSHEGSHDQDEIDFEFLGNNKWSVQTDYYVNGVGHNEEVISLGFDCSESPHQYAIYYGNDAIKWYIDGRLVRTVTNSGSVPFPAKEQYAYWSLWDASKYNPWAGVTSFSSAPYSANFSGNKILDGDVVPQV